jgi:hypothetical protein
MMTPALSRRLAQCKNARVFLELGIDEWFAFIQRAESAKTWEGLSDEDQELIKKAEEEIKS